MAEAAVAPQAQQQEAKAPLKPVELKAAEGEKKGPLQRTQKAAEKLSNWLRCKGPFYSPSAALSSTGFRGAEGEKKGPLQRTQKAAEKLSNWFFGMPKVPEPAPA